MIDDSEVFEICHLCKKESESLEDGICERCICKRERDIEDEENWDRIEYADRKRCSGRDGSEDDGW